MVASEELRHNVSAFLCLPAGEVPEAGKRPPFLKAWPKPFEWPLGRMRASEALQKNCRKCRINLVYGIPSRSGSLKRCYKAHICIILTTLICKLIKQYYDILPCWGIWGSAACRACRVAWGHSATCGAFGVVWSGWGEGVCVEAVKLKVPRARARERRGSRMRVLEGEFAC